MNHIRAATNRAILGILLALPRRHIQRNHNLLSTRLTHLSRFRVRLRPSPPPLLFHHTFLPSLRSSAFRPAFHLKLQLASEGTNHARQGHPFELETGNLRLATVLRAS